VIEPPLFGKLGLPEANAQELAQALLQQIPAKRFGKPEEVATAVAFLASESRTNATSLPRSSSVRNRIMHQAESAKPKNTRNFSRVFSESGYRKHKEMYQEIVGRFRPAFRDVGGLGSFDDVTSGKDFGVVEVRRRRAPLSSALFGKASKL
jgi:hypothetical protein